MGINLNVDNNNVKGSFDRIAKDLLNNFLLKINNVEYRIAEIEFYYKGEKHNDVYAHCDELQKEFGKWYFHGSGFDLTIGQNGYCGGILIRAINRITSIPNRDKAYVYGPLNVVKELFSNITISEYSDLKFGLIKEISGAFKENLVFKGPRVGLNSKTNNEYFNKNYRYLVMPEKKHADKTRFHKALLENDSFSKEEADKIWA